jgi:hypothetical protein
MSFADLHFFGGGRWGIFSLAFLRAVLCNEVGIHLGCLDLTACSFGEFWSLAARRCLTLVSIPAGWATSELSSSLGGWLAVAAKGADIDF